MFERLNFLKLSTEVESIGKAVSDLQEHSYQFNLKIVGIPELMCEFVSNISEAYTCSQCNNSTTNWLCSDCLAQIFPFNHLDDTSFDLVIFEDI